MNIEKGIQNLLRSLPAGEPLPENQLYVQITNWKRQLLEIEDQQRTYGILDLQDLKRREIILRELDKIALTYTQHDFYGLCQGKDAPFTPAIPPGDQAVDYAILSALTEERKAVCRMFNLDLDQVIQKGVRRYWRGNLPNTGGEYHSVVVTEASNMGNVEAATLTKDVLHHWSPRRIVLVGIAAAADEEVSLGDIVVGEFIYYYEAGKETIQGKKPEPKIYYADPSLLANAKAAPDWPGNDLVPRPDGSTARPGIHFGGIATGEKVIANPALRDEIKSHHRKILAVEMESYGVHLAAWQEETQVPAIAIKAIVDKGDQHKTNQWHAYAEIMVADYLKHLIKSNL